MNPEDRRSSASANANGHGNRQEGDDEFGDFEGFENDDAAAANIPAAAGPSPWATFPDLLPVQTSPANPSSNDEPACAGAQAAAAAAVRGHDILEPPEAWMIGGGAVGGDGAVGQLNMGGFNPMIARTVNNPPDISLISACSGANGGAFNGLDPVSGDRRHVSGLSTVESDARHQRDNAISLQINDMRQQIDLLTSQRLNLEHQLAEAARERQRLSGELNTSHARVVELQNTLQDNLIAGSSSGYAEAKQLKESEHSNQEQLRETLQQIQESLSQIRHCQIEDRESIVELRANLNVAGARRESDGNCASSSSNNSCKERTRHLEELEVMIERTVRKCLGEMTHQKSCSENDDPASQQHCIIEEFRAEMRGQMEQTQQLLECERRHHSTLLSRTVQLALKQLSTALNSINLEEETENSKMSNS